jgi:cell division protease FtsH
VAAQIDKEVTKFIKNAEVQARKILFKKKNLLDKIAKILITKETIEREEFEKLIGMGKTETSKPLIKKGRSIKVKVGRV